jgi:hypothetical protein
LWCNSYWQRVYYKEGKGNFLRVSAAPPHAPPPPLLSFYSLSIYPFDFHFVKTIYDIPPKLLYTPEVKLRRGSSTIRRGGRLTTRKIIQTHGSVYVNSAITVGKPTRTVILRFIREFIMKYFQMMGRWRRGN